MLIKLISSAQKMRMGADHAQEKMRILKGSSTWENRDSWEPWNHNPRSFVIPNRKIIVHENIKRGVIMTWEKTPAHAQTEAAAPDSIVMGRQSWAWIRSRGQLASARLTGTKPKLISVLSSILYWMRFWGR